MPPLLSPISYKTRAYSLKFNPGELGGLNWQWRFDDGSEDNPFPNEQTNPRFRTAQEAETWLENRTRGQYLVFLR